MFLFYFATTPQLDWWETEFKDTPILAVPAISHWDLIDKRKRLIPNASHMLVAQADRIVAILEGQPMSYYKHREDIERELTAEEQDQIVFDLLQAVPFGSAHWVI